MKAVLAAISFVVLIAASAAHAEAPPGFSDPATKQWFNDLKVPHYGDAGCCDQADCRRTKATIIGAVWWAESRVFPEKWLPIPSARVLTYPSIFPEAIICEGDVTKYNEPRGADQWVQLYDGPAGNPVTGVTWLYCFVFPPQFF